MMDGLSVDEVEGEMVFDLQVAFPGIGREVLFGEDGVRFGFVDELFQNIKRLAFTYYEIRITFPQIFIEGIQAFVEEIFSACRLGVKSRVEDKDRDNGTSLESGVKRSVIRQT